MFKFRKGTSEKPEYEEKILSADSDFYTTETYKSIRTNIMFSLPKIEDGKVIAVTSSSPGEGKTTTSINVAITFSQIGAKVILVDCDLRKARVHRYLGLERGEGVTNILCGYSDVDKAIKKNVRENLDVLSAGENAPNPAELLESEEFDKLIKSLQKEYDYVIIDTPPATVVTDAVVVSRTVMGVVVVVRENSTVYDLLDETFDMLKRANANIIGTIVVDSEKKGKKYKYYSKKGYNYHYGDTFEKA